MPFISYAQNFEDVMLWRALHDVQGGFYVDIGAADPKEYSVTRAFYERGWSGINLEPLDEYFHKLTQDRLRDTNLQIAAGRDAGLRTLYTFPGTGLSTLDPQVAQRQQDADWKCSERAIPVLPLTQILTDYASRDIHFLKIDVEGAEGEVLEGLDLDRVRPWIIVVEATEPSSTVGTRAKWEHLVTGRGYDFVYFDGLNAFYLANDKSFLKERLAVPPNVFDDFVQWRESRLADHVAGLEKQLKLENSETTNLRLGLEAEKNALASVQAQANHLHNALTAEQAQTNHLHNALTAEQAQTSNLRNALAAEQAQTSHLHNALTAEQAQTSNLRNALAAEQAQAANLQAQIANLHYASLARLDYLSSRIENVHAQLAFPWVDRAAGRIVKGLHEKGDQLTGGGIRAAVRRVVKAWLCNYLAFSGRHPRLTVIPRTILRPFPRLTAALYHIAVPPTPVSTTEAAVLGPTGTEPLPAENQLPPLADKTLPPQDPSPAPNAEFPSPEDPIEELTASARPIYLKLKAAVSRECSWRNLQ